ncbi:MAG: tetratricopeptide repeat protein [Verrucomicrobiae bacterium]|nr:tetratricopeptide repeat protein [Verrucomicrobiae bacterium]
MLRGVPAFPGEGTHELFAGKPKRERGSVDALSLSQEMVVRHLGGTGGSMQASPEPFWARFDTETDRAARHGALLNLLPLPAEDLDRARTQRFLDDTAAGEETHQNPWGWLLTRMLEGQVAYRRGDFDRALRLLEPVASNLDNRRLAVLGRYVIAMALHRVGKRTPPRHGFTTRTRSSTVSCVRALYLRARAHPGFDSEAAIESGLRLAESVPLLLVLAGDEAGMVAFLRQAFRELDIRTPHYGFAIAWLGDRLPSDLMERIRIEASTPIETEPWFVSAAGWLQQWFHLGHGMALHGLGEYDAALKHLEGAIASHDDNCSTSAKAYAGLAAWKLGRRDDARRWLSQAEEALRIRVEAGSGMLDPHWWHMATTDLALRQAREWMGQPTEATPSTPPTRAGRP